MSIDYFRPYLLKANLFGMDINKKGTKGGEVKVAECGGIISGTIYLMTLMIGLSYNKLQNDELMFEHACAIMSISFIILLGFGDDVFDLPWRFKLILPTIGSLPILVSYQGVTDILLPKFIVNVL